MGIALAFAIASSGCRFRAEATAVEIGKPVPEYSAVSLSGNQVRLADLRGHVVLLNIWATWCAPCREEIPYLQKLFEERSSQGLDVVGVSVDAPGEDSQVRAFLEELKVTYPVWRDPDQRVMSLFLSLGVPASYLVDRHGVLRWRHLGVLRPGNSEFLAALETALAAPAKQ